MIEVINPATEEVLERLEPASREEVDAAVERARDAFPQWSGLPPAERARLL